MQTWNLKENRAYLSNVHFPVCRTECDIWKIAELETRFVKKLEAYFLYIMGEHLSSTVTQFCIGL